MTSNNTFWKLINNQGIEIPSIQRDYAQGRMTGKIPVIRKKFISSIFHALTEKEPPLGLDFVYGKIFGIRNEEEFRRNKRAIESLLNSIKNYADSIDLTIAESDVVEKNNDKGAMVYLIPLDGQQRLTTLFLIHWYVFKKCGKANELQLLKRFRYKIRKSSESFIQLLCQPDSFGFKKNIKEEIINLEKFSNTWLNDPTVASMLNVIQEIHDFVLNSGIDENQMVVLYNNLVSKDLIYFDFLNLKDFDLSDDLYVKMNARGKQLSDFENFKAWLFNIIDSENLIDEDRREEYFKSFDIEWNDIFWNSKEESVFEIDEAFLNYFKMSFLSDFIGNYIAKEDSIILKNALEYYKNSEVVNQLITSLNDFDFESFFDNAVFKENLSKYFRFLDLCRIEASGVSNLEALDEIVSNSFNFYVKKDEELTFSKFFFSKKILNSNWWQKLYFFSIQRYVLKLDKPISRYSDKEKNNLKNYDRVVSNLIFNTYVDSPEDFRNYLKSIEGLLQDIEIEESIYGQYDLISNLSFVSIQKEDEILKCKLINEENKNWEEEIYKAEKHNYFYGQIKFLLDISNNDISEFKSLYNKIAPLFSSEILNDKEYILQRGLLTFGNYFVDKSNNKMSFCKNSYGTVRERNENWRQIFNNPEKKSLIQSLIEHSEYKSDEIKQSLLKIIGLYKDSNDIETIAIKDIEYYKLYIYCPDLFEYGESKLIQLHNNKYGFQLNASMSVGYFNELITYFIKKAYFKDIENVEYHVVKGWDNTPYIEINGTKIILNAESDCLNVEDEKGVKHIASLIESKQAINQILN